MRDKLGPTLEHRVSRATRYIESQLDATGRSSWSEARDYLAQSLGIKHGLTIDPVLHSVIDLESAGLLAHDIPTGDYRRPVASDPVGAPLAEVAESILELGWPTAQEGGHRTIHQTFVALEARYRHADVYRAMHERLKGRELELYAMKCWRARGELAIAATRLADPNTTIAQAQADERKLEAELVTAYVATLNHSVVREQQIDGLRADIYDRKRRLIVEAKATVEGFFPAIGQAHRYRFMMNLSSRAQIVDRIAVLLPSRPSESDLTCAASMYLDLDVIWREDDGFVHRELN